MLSCSLHVDRFSFHFIKLYGMMWTQFSLFIYVEYEFMSIILTHFMPLANKSLISWYPMLRFAYVGANTVPIAVAWSCKKYSLSKTQVLFYNIKSIDSKIKGILNLGWISSLYFNKKYLTASIPKVCGMFVYRPTTSKVAITVFLSVFLSHLLRKSILSLM